MINLVYYDGDSFSCMGVRKNAGQFLAEKFNCQLIHKGSVGKSPTEIIHDFLNTNHNQDTLYFIGIGVGVRNIKIAQNGTMTRLTQEQYAKKYVDDYVTEDYRLLVMLLMLSGYCRSKNLKYLIHNLDYDNYIKMTGYAEFNCIIDEFKADTNLVGFFDGCSLHHLMKQHNLPGWDDGIYKDNGHPTQAGHEMYATFLEEKIKQLYEI